MSVVVFGQYPRSEELVRATRAYDRKRAGEEDLLASFEKDRLAFKKEQLGLNFLSSGLFHWEDLLRPFAELIQDVKPGPLTRFFETNTFWRKLEAPPQAKFQEEKIEEWIEKYFFPGEIYSKDEPMIFTFPFLYLFRNFSSGIDLPKVQSILEAVITVIDRKYRGMVVFLEPNIGWEPLESQEKKAALRFLEGLKSKTKIPLAIMQFFSPVGKEKDFLFSLPLDFIGVDFYCNRLTEISKNFPKKASLLAGIISTESTMLEPEEHIKKFMQDARRLMPDVAIFATTSGPAELLPREVMDQKIRAMKEILWI